MRKSTMLVLAVGLVIALSTPVFGMVLAANQTTIAARTQDRESLNVQLLPPLAKRTSWYGGAVIPVKVLITDPDDGSGVVGATVTLWVNGQPASSPGMVNVGNNFTDLGAGYYQFNLNTKPYPAGPGSAPIDIMIDTRASDDRSHVLEVSISLN